MTRNVEMPVHAAEALGELKDEVVFVGGAIDLFITDPAAPRPRFTEDVDVVVEVTKHAAWARMGERLRALGFREDRREGAPVCRWLFQQFVMDVTPALERVLGFTNRWYRQARKQSEKRELPGGVRIRAVTAPLFLATKIEALRSRGRGDFVASQHRGRGTRGARATARRARAPDRTTAAEVKVAGPVRIAPASASVTFSTRDRPPFRGGRRPGGAGATLPSGEPSRRIAARTVVFATGFTVIDLSRRRRG